MPSVARPSSGAPEPGPPPDDLTEREFDVLRLLALGHTNPEIAAQLHLSVRTVEAHRAHLQHKLSRPSRAELVRYALDRGLLHGTEDPAREASRVAQKTVAQSSLTLMTVHPWAAWSSACSAPVVYADSRSSSCRMSRRKNGLSGC